MSLTAVACRLYRQWCDCSRLSCEIVNKVSGSFAMLAKNLIMQVSNAIRPTCSPGHRLPFEKDQTEASRRALLGILLGTFICLVLVI